MNFLIFTYDMSFFFLLINWSLCMSQDVCLSCLCFVCSLCSGICWFWSCCFCLVLFSWIASLSCNKSVEVDIISPFFLPLNEAWLLKRTSKSERVRSSAYSDLGMIVLRSLYLHLFSWYHGDSTIIKMTAYVVFCGQGFYVQFLNPLVFLITSLFVGAT